MNKIFYLILLLISVSCAVNKTNSHQVIWVNSSKVPCTGVAPMHCMQIQTGNVLNQDNWTLFYDSIEGFDYIPGNIYKLKVSVISLDPDLVPADASTKKYKLIEVISKTPDVKLNLNDIWVFTHLNGTEITVNSENERPQMEVNLSENRVFGKGACNRFNGSIKKLSGNTLKFDERMMSTKMMCQNMKLEDAFFKILAQTNSYQIKNNHLYLFDSGKKEIARFKKTD
ncbi:DUF4377 domain-containing protein [Tenacibaculum sp. MAR_2009_124]|uniref:DUF4377 domain-containing protein n=1 Tax=Tenacibaculum sp. MAR_2009_124 TaxID=1250059 RepID=UPI0015A0772A|nr:DUF4377 domain-containing protein [Tenacibaculum sp. MAR_2009_124]